MAAPLATDKAGAGDRVDAADLAEVAPDAVAVPAAATFKAACSSDSRRCRRMSRRRSSRE